MRLKGENVKKLLNIWIFERNVDMQNMKLSFIHKNKYYSKIVNDDNLIADHIIRAKGPSGTNLEYFLNVCNAIRNLIKENTTSDDQNEFYIKNEKHLFELEKNLLSKILTF